MHRYRVLAATAALTAGLAVSAPAQSLGTFTWQLQPFCNRLTVNVTQSGGLYTLDGFDDQCGAPQRAPLVGLATPNPDGTIGFGFHIATSPGGKTVSVEARISLATIGGPWTDSAGNSGTLVLNGSAAGSARPAPTGQLTWGVQLDAPPGSTTAGFVVTTPTSGEFDPPAIGVAFGTPASLSPPRTAGIMASSQDSIAIAGLSDTVIGVLGQSQSGVGIAGLSFTGEGVGGVSLAGAGVHGQTSNGIAVLAEAQSAGGTALDLRNGALRVSGATRPVFQHTTTAGNTAGHVTTLDHPLLNGDPNAMVFISRAFVAGTTVNDPHEKSVWYDTAMARWRVFHDDNAAMPLNLRFHVLVVKQ